MVTEDGALASLLQTLFLPNGFVFFSDDQNAQTGKTVVADHGLKRVCLTFAVIVDMLPQELHSFRSIRTQAVATRLGVLIDNLLYGANLIWRES